MHHDMFDFLYIAAMPVLAACWAVALAQGSRTLYLRLPARWLCEYGEAPGLAHQPAGRFRSGALPTPVGSAPSPLAGRAQSPTPGSASEACALARPSRLRPALAAVALFACILIHMTLTGTTTATDTSDPGTAADIPSLLLLSLAAVPLIVAAFSDLDYMIIPDQVPVTILALSLGRALAAPASELIRSATVAEYTGASQSNAAYTPSQSIHSYLSMLPAELASVLTGILICGGIMLLAALLARLLHGPGAMGVGDIKLLAACGGLVGADHALLLYVLTVLPSAIFFAIAIMLRRITSSTVQPLAPWISLATGICLALPY